MIKVRIKVDKADLISRLEKFSAEMKVGLLPAWQRIGRRLHQAEISMAPVDTGNLRNSITTTAYVMGVKSKSDAIDPRNGYNYARIQHDGGYAEGWAGPHIIAGKFYMDIPLLRTDAGDELEYEIDKIIARCGLN